MSDMKLIKDQKKYFQKIGWIRKKKEISKYMDQVAKEDLYQSLKKTDVILIGIRTYLPIQHLESQNKQIFKEIGQIFYYEMRLLVTKEFKFNLFKKGCNREKCLFFLCLEILRQTLSIQLVLLQIFLSFRKDLEN
ncbi:unnamed protein product [Paramecium pentaurelia]|uniref:Uncharacterized protein n=1 Tax=Paramecium pentaurelia TaxID=43138 RepID=A0A8S1YDC3_9CILI|nr:unnamed protein product [Paramecium pentaurelia]